MGVEEAMRLGLSDWHGARRFPFSQGYMAREASVRVVMGNS